jgi:hypothetical protein
MYLHTHDDDDEDSNNKKLWEELTITIFLSLK